MHKVSAVIAAGGKGKRMGIRDNKVYMPLKGQPVLSRTLTVFEACRLIDEIIVVVPQDEKDLCIRRVIGPLGIAKTVKITAGGKERQDSVRCGLREISANCDFVVVHDGARPLLTSALLEAVIREAFSWGAAIVAVPVKDTIKVADDKGMVVDTPARDRLWSVQTPQAFRKDILMEAHAAAVTKGISATDDAFLVEKLGLPVKIVPGEYDNIKITTPEDISIGEGILSRRRDLNEAGDGL